jgi:hypothetical protein
VVFENLAVGILPTAEYKKLAGRGFSGVLAGKSERTSDKSQKGSLQTRFRSG